MNKALKKTLSILLTVLMIVSTVPFAFASDIASGTFGVDNALTWILDNGLLTISGNGAMRGDTEIEIPWAEYKDSITDVVIEEGVTDVADYAFKDYSNLKTAYIANSVKTIYDGAFRNCASMEKIFIGSGVELMTVYCFFETNCIVHYNGTSEMWYAIEEGYNGKPWSAVHYLTVASKEPTCADAGYENAYACSSCDATFGGTIIPATGEHTRVNKVCTVCGDGCTHPAWTNGACDTCGDPCVHPSYTESECDVCKSACNHIYYENGICTACSYECEHYWYGYDCYTCGLKGGELNSDIIWTLNTDTGVFILNGTGDMPEYSYYRDIPWFNDLRGYIKTVIISEGITSICADAFYWCSNLTSVTLPDTLNKIGGAAFCDCSSLENIVIPSGVTTLDASTFVWCSALKTIHYLGTENALTIDETNNELAEDILHFCEEKCEVSQTCKEDGFTDGWYCDTCDEYAVGGETIPATGEHDWSKKDGVCARGCGTECQHDSYTDGVCDNCGAECLHESYTECVCDACGYECPHEKYTMGICDECNYLCPHSFTVFNETVAPKCEETGWEESYCDYCSIKLEQELPALDHDWVSGGVKRPVQNIDLSWSDGYYYDSCKNDGTHTKITGVAKRGDYDTFNALLAQLKGYQTNADLTDEAVAKANKVINSNWMFAAGYIPQNLIENELNVYIGQLKPVAEAIEAGIADGTMLKADYTAIDEEIKAVYEALEDATISDEMKAEIEDIKAELEALKENENATLADVIELNERLEAIAEIMADCAKGVHSFTTYEEVEAPKCDVVGKEAAICDNGCGATVEKEIPALKHIDADGDYLCDYGCGTQISSGGDGGTGEPETPDDPTDNTCDHLCHKDGILGFLWKIINFFCRLFNIQQYCDCGVIHYDAPVLG